MNICYGIIEDIEDPKNLGRVKVRVRNYHEGLSVDDLEWSGVMMPATSSSSQGKGWSPTWLDKGDDVICLWLDESKTILIILGTWHGILDNDENKHDVSKLARGSSEIEKNSIGPEPDNQYKGKYPHNKVIRTKRGHAIELDDTPDNERIHFYHKNGSYIEITNDSMIIKTNGDSFDITDGKKNIFVNGDLMIESKGKMTLKADSIDMDVS